MGLAAQRAALLCSLLGLDELTLAGKPRERLTLAAAGDERASQQIGLLLAGQTDELPATLDSAKMLAVTPHASFEEALQASLQARKTFLAVLARAFDVEQHCSHDQNRLIRAWAELQIKLDTRLTGELMRWRDRAQPSRAVGPKSLLVAALRAGRKELLTVVALIPPANRETRSLYGDRTLQDVLGHIADEEARCIAGLGELAAGHTPTIDCEGDLEGCNQAHVIVRRTEPWGRTWTDLHTTHQILLQRLECLGQDDVSCHFFTQKNLRLTTYDWLCACVAHDREHAENLRVGLTSGGAITG
jgi:hypothetical protein